MKIVEVNTPLLEQAFLQVNYSLLKDIPDYIRPLHKDINDVFDPKKNKAFRFGKVIRWILTDEKGVYIGKIAAFTNTKYKSKGDDVPVGGVGFFDCINLQDAANVLFDTAKKWLAENGVQAMDGPINFGERDKWWGLVVEGYQSPLYNMNFNPPYYVQLFENYGFQPFFYQICWGLDPQKKLSDKILQRHTELSNDKKYTCKTIEKNKLNEYAQDFTTVYNKAWAGHGGLKQLSVEQVKLMFKKMKPVMDEKIIYFAYYNNEPIAMFVNIPDLNQYFKHMNGKFGLWQKLKFVFYQKFRPSKKFCGLVFGVVPEFQGKGVDSYIIEECRRIVQPKTSYTDFEMQWIGDFNTKMLNVVATFGDTFISRKLCTYRYLFDREKEFKRHPML